MEGEKCAARHTSDLYLLVLAVGMSKGYKSRNFNSLLPDIELHK